MSFILHEGDSLDVYSQWEAPDCIVSDGPYGLGLYPGEPNSVDKLIDAYRPHVEAWSRIAKPKTTLWFWNSEIGWATVHPLLVEHGWVYETCHVWDKGIAHVAGNVNSNSIRRYPVVTEICVFYSRRALLDDANGIKRDVKTWLRSEWLRSGVPMKYANDACGVKDAATRKYLTHDHLWYFPPGDMVAKMASYLEKNGKKTDRLYFSLNGTDPITPAAWDDLRYSWHHQHGLSNVWHEPSLRGRERIKIEGSNVHINQKPLALMRQIIHSCTDPGCVVWEPFGGLCSASVACIELGRRCFAAEINSSFAAVARHRLQSVNKETLSSINKNS